MEILNALALFANFVVVPATAYGAQLALGALGVTIIFGILKFANFSHGELMSFGTMITILVTWLLQDMGVGIAPCRPRFWPCRWASWRRSVSRC